MTVEVDLRKLISVDAYSDAVAIRRSGTYAFTVEGRAYREPLSGLILKYAIEGQLAGMAG